MLNIKTMMLAVSFSTILSTTAMSAEPVSKDEINQMIKEYILNNPETLIESLNQYQNAQMQKMQEDAKKQIIANKTELEKDKNTPVIGNTKGDFVIIEFFDYNCGYCKKMFPDVMDFVKKDKKTKWVMKELPTLSESSEQAAKMALAAHEQGKYQQIHSALMQHKGTLNEEKLMQIAKTAGLDVEKLKKDMNSDKIQKALSNNRELAMKIGVSGIPAFVINGEFKNGAFDKEYLTETAQKTRAEAKAAKAAKVK